MEHLNMGLNGNQYKYTADIVAFKTQPQMPVGFLLAKLLVSFLMQLWYIVLMKVYERYRKFNIEYGTSEYEYRDQRKINSRM